MSTKLKICLFRGIRIYGFWPSDNLVRESSEKIFLRFLLDSSNLSEQYTLHVQTLLLPFKRLQVAEKMEPFKQSMQVGDEFKITLIVAPWWLSQ